MSGSRFNFAEYVVDNLERAKETGTGELTAECPWCGRYGGFYVSCDSGHYICFKCEQRGRHLVGVVAQVEGVSWFDAKAFILKRAVKFRRKETVETLVERIRSLRPGRDVGESEVESVCAELPDEFKAVFADGRWRVPSYLRARGIKRKTARVWGLGYCTSGLYAGRVIVPVECPAGRSFVARATGGELPKILNPPGADHGRLLLGWYHVSPGSDVAIVEGPFDALRLWQHGFSVVALMGKTLHEKQLTLMTEHWPPDTAITVCLDPEELVSPYRVAQRLSVRFDNIYIAAFPAGVDPGAATRTQARAALDAASRYTGRMDSLVAQLAQAREKVGQRFQGR